MTGGEVLVWALVGWAAVSFPAALVLGRVIALRDRQAPARRDVDELLRAYSGPGRYCGALGHELRAGHMPYRCSLDHGHGGDHAALLNGELLAGWSAAAGDVR